MPKRPKNSFKNYGGADSPCWFCNDPTTYSLLDCKDDSEVWCCIKCLWKKGKIKRFKSKGHNSSHKQKKSIISKNLHIKNKKVVLFWEGLNDGS